MIELSLMRPQLRSRNARGAAPVLCAPDSRKAALRVTLRPDAASAPAFGSTTLQPRDTARAPVTPSQARSSMRTSLASLAENTCVNSWISTSSAHFPGFSFDARNSCLRNNSAGGAAQRLPLNAAISATLRYPRRYCMSIASKGVTARTVATRSEGSAVPGAERPRSKVRGSGAAAPPQPARNRRGIQTIRFIGIPVRRARACRACGRRWRFADRDRAAARGARPFARCAPPSRPAH